MQRVFRVGCLTADNVVLGYHRRDNGQWRWVTGPHERSNCVGRQAAYRFLRGARYAPESEIFDATIIWDESGWIVLEDPLLSELYAVDLETGIMAPVVTAEREENVLWVDSVNIDTLMRRGIAVPYGTCSSHRRLLGSYTEGAN